MENREKATGKYLEYKGKPLVREDNTICYGDMNEKCVLVLEIMSYKKFNDTEIPDKILIQILDNNVVAPKVLGGNIGISSLCVVIAIATMGYLWGWIGMMIAVPLFATVLALLDEWTVTRLQKRGYPSGIESYYANDSIVDPASNAQTTMDKMAQSFERRALLAKHREASGEKLSRKERFVLRLNAFLHRHRVITEISDEGQIRVLAEEAFRDAERETEQYLKSCGDAVAVPAETEERS